MSMVGKEKVTQPVGFDYVQHVIIKSSVMVFLGYLEVHNIFLILVINFYYIINKLIILISDSN
jgi:hypothetical protein